MRTAEEVAELRERRRRERERRDDDEGSEDEPVRRLRPREISVKINPWSICAGIWLFVLTSAVVWLTLFILIAVIVAGSRRGR